MRKYFFVLPLLLIIISFNSNAQYDQKKAKELITKSSTRYKSFKTLKAQFRYELENKMDKSKTKIEGTFYLKDGKFRLKLGEQIIICDLKTVWTYLTEVNEVQVSDYDPDMMEMNPGKMLTSWESGFLYGYVGEVKIAEKIYDLVELTPEDKSKSYFKVKLYIEKNTAFIKKVKIYEKNSSITTYTIKSFSKDITLKDDLFKFDPKKHPDVEVVDLRD